MICSDWEGVTKELDHIRLILRYNCFPQGLIEKQISRVVSKFVNNKTSQEKVKLDLAGAEGKEVETFLIVPYENIISESFGYKINRIMGNC